MSILFSLSRARAHLFAREEEEEKKALRIEP